jgi:hypothetical protein
MPDLLLRDAKVGRESIRLLSENDSFLINEFVRKCAFFDLSQINSTAAKLSSGVLEMGIVTPAIGEVQAQNPYWSGS